MKIKFARLVHADWSTAGAKRWAVEAQANNEGWIVEAPQMVGSVSAFIAKLLEEPQPTLAGFDFPIGVPAVFGNASRLSSFVEAIGKFGGEEWVDFYRVSERAEEISIHRPFYPRVSSSSARQTHLLDALEVSNINDLRRQCERATAGRRAACPLFWTLGGNQVGKAAISGWQEIVLPAMKAGARLWPFEGTLAELSRESRLVVCETYPGEAYSHVGVRFSAGGSKQRQGDRRKASVGLVMRCEERGIRLMEPLSDQIADGFGPRKNGEDQFDATIGLLGMIEVVDGRRAEGSTEALHQQWEGWILGQCP